MNTDNAITVEDLTKYYQVHRSESGLGASLRSLFRRHYDTVKAVDGVSFHVAQGEIVGFLGSNGAGKTTTLKCLAGLLHPTSGSTRVLGYTPHQRKRAFLSQITLVMGQRNQLLWDLPPMETFLVNQAIYRIPNRAFHETLDHMVELLDMEALLTKPVRQLSLGERMKCELVASLLHQPRVLFLDEPTIGLDVMAQVAIRDFLQAYNERYNVTILLTSHYMADVTALAKRVMIIDHGTLLYDGDLHILVDRTTSYKLLHLSLERPVQAADIAQLGEIEKVDGPNIQLRIPRESTTDIIAAALSRFPISDITVVDPPFEEVIRDILQQEEVIFQPATSLSDPA